MRLVTTLIFIIMFALAACSSDDATDTADSVEALPTTAEEAAAPMETVVEDPAPTAEVAAPTVETVVEQVPPTAEEVVTTVDRPAWQTIALTDARTGETFTLADFAGKTVFVEPMATWCGNCRAQLNRVKQARTQLNADDYVFIALSLETNLSDDELAAYTEREGFDWTFAVMSMDLLGQLSDEFGRPIRSAPNTPHFVIRPDGTFTSLSTGAKSIEQIVGEMQAESEA